MRLIPKMNDSEKTRLRNAIATRLEEISQENERGAEGQSVVMLDQQSVGRLSRMDALQNQAMAVAQQNRRDQEQRRLQAALERLEDEDFGYCEDCGDAIAYKRLELDPACRICVPCASA
ncbi:MAG: TraR/DksA family transcriptional regulator [Arenibacterium sp.]